MKIFTADQIAGMFTSEEDAINKIVMADYEPVKKLRLQASLSGKVSDLDFGAQSYDLKIYKEILRFVDSFLSLDYEVLAPKKPAPLWIRVLNDGKVVLHFLIAEKTKGGQTSQKQTKHGVKKNGK